MNEIEKSGQRPQTYITHDDKEYTMEIELPGVDKGDIDLAATENAICVRAEGAHKLFRSCLSLAHHVNTEKIEATFNNGLLTVKAPFQKQLKGRRIEIK